MAAMRQAGTSTPLAIHFTLKSLLLFCAYVALVCAGLLSTNRVWAELVIATTFLAIIFAAVVSLFGPDRGRATWGSFALAAAAYLALTVYPGQFRGFPTSQILEFFNVRIESMRIARLGPPAGGGMGGMGGGMGGMGGGMSGMGGGMGSTPPYSYFQLQAIQAGRDNTPRVGHCVFAAILGFIAAEVGRRASRKKQNERAQNAA
jgi:hypothetical protein